MQEINRTEIATLGEFGLIKHLTKDIELKNPETQYGVGDDAAVLEFKDKEVLVTTDLLMEGVHFDLVYTPLKHLGYKSAIVNFSDIYAMNGTPKQITVSIALSKRFCIEDLEQFYDGLKLACELHHVDIVGGDTTSSVTGLAISITCIGEADKARRQETCFNQHIVDEVHDSQFVGNVMQRHFPDVLQHSVYHHHTIFVGLNHAHISSGEVG